MNPGLSASNTWAATTALGCSSHIMPPVAFCWERISIFSPQTFIKYESCFGCPAKCRGTVCPAGTARTEVKGGGCLGKGCVCVGGGSKSTGLGGRDIRVPVKVDKSLYCSEPSLLLCIWDMMMPTSQMQDKKRPIKCMTQGLVYSKCSVDGDFLPLPCGPHHVPLSKWPGKEDPF